MKNINQNKKWFGIVEGFFSRPLSTWTKRERKGILRLCLNQPNFNIYIYCPKDDPYVTTLWNKRYPKKRLSEIQEAAKLCRTAGVTFCYGLNPDLGKGDQIETSLAAAKDKLEQLLTVGVRDICLLFDDTPYAYDVTAEKKSDADRQSGQLQVAFANAIAKDFGDRLNSKWFCPSNYFFLSETPYTKELRKLEPDFMIFWTGRDIFVDSIKTSEVLRAKKVLGVNRKLVWWSNYPVNDCFYPVGTYFAGTFNPPQREALVLLDGIVVNPMREAAANYPFVDSFLAWLRSPKSPKRSLFQGWNTPAQIEKIYASFASRSIVDPSPVGYYSDLLNLQSEIGVKEILSEIERGIMILKTSRFKRREQDFFTETKAIIKEAELFCRMGRKAFSRTPYKNLWQRYDAFPLVLGKADYIGKAYAILMKRIAYTEKIAGKAISTRELKKLYLKTLGHSSLELPTAFTKEWYREFEKIRSADSGLFFAAISQDSPISALQRIIRRKHMHVFSPKLSTKPTIKKYGNQNNL